MKTDRQRFSRKKFEALTAYILARRPDFDESALCFTLMQIDFQSYAQTGKSITGATYVKGETHPIPCHL